MQKGMEKGMQKGMEQIVENLLEQKLLTDDQILRVVPISKEEFMEIKKAKLCLA